MAPAQDVLERMARRYIWWKTSEQALEMPEHVVAQVMTMGDHDDVETMMEAIGEDYARQVMRCAQAGWFTPRAWAYWHYRLGLTPPTGLVPSLPVRRFG